LGKTNADVLVVGAGPAGISTAIAASLKGLKVSVADLRKPPIDKPCGEGLLPEGVAALRTLGIHLTPRLAFPLTGIRFVDDHSSASAMLPRGAAFGLRRTVLHQLLMDWAMQLGVSFLWGARVSELHPFGARVDGSLFRCKWIVGADGQNSLVRKWARLDPVRPSHSRFGFCRHFSISPWASFVEVYWGERCQAFVTPVGHDQVCVAILSNDSRLRIGNALAFFPAIAERLRGAKPSSPELGAITALSRARAVSADRVALVGDASFCVDGIAGQGMSLAFQQAVRLGEALARNDLSYYSAAHRRITKGPARITRLLLQLGRSAWLRRKTIRLFANNPGLFSKAICVHTSGIESDQLKVREVFDFGWQVLRA
jgi:flavin-dependent dehydrogenase